MTFAEGINKCLKKFIESPEWRNINWKLNFWMDNITGEKTKIWDAGYKTAVLPVSTEEYGLSKAARPFNSRLDKSKLVEAGFTPLPTWQDALSRYLKEIEQ